MMSDIHTNAIAMTPAANAADQSSPVATVDCRLSGWGGILRGHCLLLLLLLGFMSSMFQPGAVAQVKPVGEYELKAALLPKLGLFVKWPASAFANAGSPFVIGVLGENPFGQHLENAIHGRMIDGHPLTVQPCRDVREAARCHIVFIRGGDAKAMDDALSQLAGTSVLAVSDVPGFASQGGMVNLVIENQKVRLEVNLEAIQKAELRIDPQLLKLAKVVKSTAPKPQP